MSSAELIVKMDPGVASNTVGTTNMAAMLCNGCGDLGVGWQRFVSLGHMGLQ